MRKMINKMQIGYGFYQHFLKCGRIYVCDKKDKTKRQLQPEKKTR